VFSFSNLIYGIRITTFMIGSRTCG